MKYYKMLYEETAMLLLYRVQMAEPYSTVISRYFGEYQYRRYSGENQIKDRVMEKYMCAIAILLSLDRNGCKISVNQLNELEEALSDISDDFISDCFSEEDRLAFYEDLKIAKRNIDYYRTRKEKLK